MIWLKKIFSSQSSQETKLYCEVEKDKKEEEKDKIILKSLIPLLLYRIM